MAWYVRFIPNECDRISVMVNNEAWTSWHRTEGNKRVILPDRFRNLGSVKIGATVAPEGKNGTIEVDWDGRMIKRYDFDNYEDHTVSNAPPRKDPPDRGVRGSSGPTTELKPLWANTPLFISVLIALRSRRSRKD